MNIDTESWVIVDAIAPLGFPVGTKRPAPKAPRPPKWFRVFQSGGIGYSPNTENSLIGIEAYAGLEKDARAMLNDAIDALTGLNGRLFGASVTGGPTNLPDPDSEQARYTALLVVRARAALTA